MDYQLNSFVNRKEAEALKELIFKRARERANNMTSDVQTDIMSVARESFVSSNNPFSQIAAQAALAKTSETEEVVKPKPVTKALQEIVEEKEKQEEVGFPIKDYTGIVNQNRMIKEQITTAQLQNTMIEARQGLSDRKSFMGALAFLNSHAAASLLNKRSGKGIDVVA